MHNGTMIITCCLLLLAISTVNSFAGKVMVTADLNSPGTPVSMTVANADINTVLAALFNAADNTRQVRIGFGVIGNIDSLQLDAVPFDTALAEILAKVNGEYSYTKSNATTYHIKAPAEPITAPVMSFQQANVADNTVKMVKVMLPIIPKTTDSTATLPADPLDPAAKPTAEEAILAVINVRNINVVDLAKALGYEYLEAFGASDRNTGGTRSSGRNSNNYYNDQYYNDNYNTNSNTRWTDPNSQDYSRRYTDPNSPYYDRRADPRSRYYDAKYRP